MTLPRRVPPEPSAAAIELHGATVAAADTLAYEISLTSGEHQERLGRVYRRLHNALMVVHAVDARPPVTVAQNEPCVTCGRPPWAPGPIPEGQNTCPVCGGAVEPYVMHTQFGDVGQYRPLEQEDKQRASAPHQEPT